MSGTARSGLIPAVSAFLVLASAAFAQVAPLPLPPAPGKADAPASQLEAAPLPSLPSSIAPVRTPLKLPPPIAERPASIEVLPQVAAPAARVEHSPFLEGLYMPGIASALLLGKAESLPDTKDTRQYVFSIYRGMTGSCGARSDSSGLDAVGYVEPGLGAGRDSNKFAASQGMKMLLAIAQAHKTGDVNAFARTLSADAFQTSEGLSDGSTIASRLGCQSRDYNGIVVAIESLMSARSGKDYGPDDRLAFVTLMNPSYRQQLGIEDPAVTLRRQQLKKAVDLSRATCKKRYDSPVFCDCLTNRLQGKNLGESDWMSISNDFGSIIQVALRNSDVAQSIRSCVRG